MARRALTIIVFLASVAALAAAGSSTQTVRDADAMRAKLQQIVIKGQSCPCAARTRTALSEREVNAYITHHAKDDLPEGVVSPHVTI
ncbi:MAG: hypothetical protein H0X44_05920, partial [Acidobacteria bacterium]|nr:hypothetical protein [Acidobacteriota bacterium]